MNDYVALLDREKMVLGTGALVSDFIYAQAYLRSLERLKQSCLALSGRENKDIGNYIAQLEQEKITADVDLKLQNSFERAVMEKGVNIVIGLRFVTEHEVKTTGFTGKELSQDAQMLLKDSAYSPVYVEIPDFVKEQVSEEEAKSWLFAMKKTLQRAFQYYCVLPSTFVVFHPI